MQHTAFFCKNTVHYQSQFYHVPHVPVSTFLSNVLIVLMMLCVLVSLFPVLTVKVNHFLPKWKFFWFSSLNLVMKLLMSYPSFSVSCPDKSFFPVRTCLWFNSFNLSIDNETDEDDIFHLKWTLDSSSSIFCSLVLRINKVSCVVHLRSQICNHSRASKRKKNWITFLSTKQ